MKRRLRVATYNICHCLDFSEGKKPSEDCIRPKKTADAIRLTNADVVGLNEVYNQGAGLLEKQPERLGEYAEYAYSAFARAIWINASDGRRAYGNGFLSRYPILSTESVAVPSPPIEERVGGSCYEDRVILRTVVSIEQGKEITVFITHFGLNVCEQERMVNRLIELIDSEENPVILMGDFNVVPDSEILKPIYDRLQSAAKVCKNTQYTFATYEPSITIDYIFASKEFIVKDFKRVETNVSDHFPCVAELEMDN